KIEPLFAYLGIGATIFAGVEPRKSGVFWDYVRQSAGKPSRVYEFMVLLSEAIPNDRLAKDCRHIISHLLGRPSPTPNLVPADLLNEFRPTVPGRLYDSPTIGESPTLFEILDRCGIPYARVNLYGEMSDY